MQPCGEGWGRCLSMRWNFRWKMRWNMRWIPCGRDFRIALLLSCLLGLLVAGGGCSAIAVTSTGTGQNLAVDSHRDASTPDTSSPTEISTHDLPFQGLLPPQMRACLPARLHPVSGMFLKAWMMGRIATPTFRRFFHMPNSDYLKVSECLVAARKSLWEEAPRKV